MKPAQAAEMAAVARRFPAGGLVDVPGDLPFRADDRPMEAKLMATVRPGIYLEDNHPARSQFRVGRREPVRGVIIVHTAESGTDTDGDDPKAENVANFIRGRDDAGSYHLLGDRDSIVQLVRFANEAYHCKGGANKSTIGISLAMNAEDWPTLPVDARNELLDTAGQMAVIAIRWLEARGVQVPLRWLTRSEYEAGHLGFVSHANADPTPGRRSDPGDGFPAGVFLQRVDSFMRPQQGQQAATSPDPVDVILDALQPQKTGSVSRLQQSLNQLGADPALVVDGIVGPKTRAALAGYLSAAYLQELGPSLPGLVITADPSLVPGTVIYERAG